MARKSLQALGPRRGVVSKQPRVRASCTDDDDDTDEQNMGGGSKEITITGVDTRNFEIETNAQSHLLALCRQAEE